jgi:hypothetical protein
VLGHGDPYLANFLCDADQVRLVDFEDSGPSDRAFDLTRAEAARVHDFRCHAALFWLIMLRPGSTSSTRNPPGTLERQAHRLLELLG